MPIEPSDLRELADDAEALWEVARRAIEDDLIEMRDARISFPFRNNGLVVKEMDGQDSSVIRMGAETAMRVGLLALADHIEAERRGSPEPVICPFTPNTPGPPRMNDSTVIASGNVPGTSPIGHPLDFGLTDERAPMYGGSDDDGI